jgi:beta-galactosidase
MFKIKSHFSTWFKNIFLVISFFPLLLFANVGTTSVAGFFPIEGSGRLVYNFNNGWRFVRGDVKNAEKTNFDDSLWEPVATPHTVQLMPAEASGNRNYQGIAWYRKRFVVPNYALGKDVILHFEAIMGKQKFYLNGKLIKENKGGYLPVNINITSLGAQAGDTCLIAVQADNSDDRSYPPGKTQLTLDFAFHGGNFPAMCGMISKTKLQLRCYRSQNCCRRRVFVHYDNQRQIAPKFLIDSRIEKNDKKPRTVTLESVLNDKSGKFD